MYLLSARFVACVAVKAKTDRASIFPAVSPCSWNTEDPAEQKLDPPAESDESVEALEAAYDPLG